MPFRVLEVRPVGQHADLDGHYGDCDSVACVIRINADLVNDANRSDSEMHEALHALIRASRVREQLKLTDKREEDAVGVLTPHLITMLVSMGWRPPRRRKAKGA